MELRWNSRHLTTEKLRKLLRDLPDEQAVQVELIDLYNNSLESLPRELFDLSRFPNVLDLDVSHNRLSHLPTALGKHRLDALYTSANPKLPPALALDCHTRDKAMDLQQAIIVHNRAADRAANAAVLFLCLWRSADESSGPLAKLPKDVALIIAKKVYWAF